MLYSNKFDTEVEMYCGLYEAIEIQLFKTTLILEAPPKSIGSLATGMVPHSAMSCPAVFRSALLRLRMEARKKGGTFSCLLRLLLLFPLFKWARISDRRQVLYRRAIAMAYPLASNQFRALSPEPSCACACILICLLCNE